MLRAACATVQAESDEKHSEQSVSESSGRKRERPDENEECERNMDEVDRAIEMLKERNKKKMKIAVMNLKEVVEKIDEKRNELIVKLFARWLDELKGDNPEFGIVLKALINLQTVIGSEAQATETQIGLALELTAREDAMVCEEAINSIRIYFKLIIAKTSLRTVISRWEQQIAETQKQIDNGAISDWITKMMRAAADEDKPVWEHFMRTCVMKRLQRIRSITGKQSCEMTWELIKPTPKVEKVVVWNGNGIRARSAGSKELTRLVQATNPDVLCFLESKVNAERLMKIPGFEQWVESAGFRKVYCHWSFKQGESSSYGTEGIVLFSKVEWTKVTHGTGDAQFDSQARVLTVEFDDHVMIFTYNPQGGFAPETLAFRSEWEKAFTE